MINLSEDLVCVNLAKEQIDLTQIINRRFMYHPDGWLILGCDNVVSRKELLYSHAQEYHEATKICDLPGFDSFVRGWIGVGGEYKDGIVHFAPHIISDNIELFEKAFDFIEVVLAHGFTRKAILRGFPGAWEQPICNIIPEPDSLNKRLSNAIERANKDVGNKNNVNFIKE